MGYKDGGSFGLVVSGGEFLLSLCAGVVKMGDRMLIH